MSRDPQRDNNAAMILAVVEFLRRNPGLLRLAVLLLVVGVVIIAGIVLLFFLNGNWPQPQPETPPTQTTERGTEHETPVSPPDGDINLLMGNPSNAGDHDRNNYLLHKDYFALSYNEKNGTPNWVSWCLKADDMGKEKRTQLTFHADISPEFKRVNPPFKPVHPDDYTNSGFDRGHMCPFADRSGTQTAAQSTFVMTNIIPQAPACNREAWAHLEEHCRELVRHHGKTLYIVCGPDGEGGIGAGGDSDKLRRAGVVIPKMCWKVILVLNNGKGDPEDINRVNRDSELIAVEMPNDENDERLHQKWEKSRTTVKQVENNTHLHFFDRVPAEIINALKERDEKEHSHR